QVMTAISMGGAFLAYVVGSLLSRQEPPDLDRLLHRGKWQVRDDHERELPAPARGWRMLGMGKEFSRGDRTIYLATYVWTLGWFAFFVIGTVHNLANPVDDAWWEGFWRVYVMIQAGLAVFVTVWMGIGGIRDVRDMLRRLRMMGRDDVDDGFVR
ncbi:sodium:solute symporter, partial [bacterium]|nr:sodium:solute symporter [bacterium]